MVNSVYIPSPSRYENGMLFRRCGKSGILLPAVSLGLWQNFGDVNPFANSQAMVHYAFDRGIVHFDLANNYGPSYARGFIAFSPLAQGLLTNRYLNGIPVDSRMAKGRTLRSCLKFIENIC